MTRNLKLNYDKWDNSQNANLLGTILGKRAATLLYVYILLHYIVLYMSDIYVCLIMMCI